MWILIVAQVRCEDPRWPKYIAGLVQHSCQRLGIKYSPQTHRFQLDAITALSQKYAEAVPLASSRAILDALSVCLRVRALEACTTILKRTVDIKLLTENYINTVLIPLIPGLRHLAPQYTMLDDFAPTIQTIMLAWIEKILGSKPQEDGSAKLLSLSSWTCNCKDCSDTRTFLTARPDERTVVLFMDISRRKHLEDHLLRYACSVCSWSTPMLGIEVSRTYSSYLTMAILNDLAGHQI